MAGAGAGGAGQWLKPSPDSPNPLKRVSAISHRFEPVALYEAKAAQVLTPECRAWLEQGRVAVSGKS